MGSIRELDYNTVVKIAAGEVIDRPASVVRELIDNAVDAKATQITVVVDHGGKSYIEVKDNGVGMDESDLALCVKNHTTSKIATFDDIDHLSTLGFRGEALSSIAEVSELTVLSRPEDSIEGHELLCRYGGVEKIRAKGMNQGTTVMVKNLFENLPARRKFLGADAGESRNVDREIVRKALAFPEIGFRMISNGKEKFHSPPRNSRLERIVDFFPDCKDFLLPVQFLSSEINVTGFTSRAAFLRKNRMYQYFFVNRRAVEWKNFSFAVSNIYGNLLPSGHYPAVFFYLNISPELVDFNVHPMKREVRFKDQQELTRIIRSSIGSALASDDGISQADESVVRFTPYEKKIAEAITDYIDKTRSDRYVSPESKETYREHRPEMIAPPTDPASGEPGPPEKPLFAEDHLSDEKRSMTDLLNYRFAGIIFSTYILLEGDQRVVFIDQHAAHERINYERFTRDYREKSAESQELLLPINIDVPLGIVDDLILNIDALLRMGFEVEHFGGNTFVIRAIPAYMSFERAPDVVMGFVECLQENEDSSAHSADFIDGAVKQMACKRSIKAGDRISSEEVTELIRALAETERPFSCPHGRPVMFSLSRTDVEKQFKRLGF